MYEQLSFTTVVSDSLALIVLRSSTRAQASENTESTVGLDGWYPDDRQYVWCARPTSCRGHWPSQSGSQGLIVGCESHRLCAAKLAAPVIENVCLSSIARGEVVDGEVPTQPPSNSVNHACEKITALDACIAVSVASVWPGTPTVHFHWTNCVSVTRRSVDHERQTRKIHSRQGVYRRNPCVLPRFILTVIPPKTRRQFNVTHPQTMCLPL
jgi:hypothetical protein